MDKYDVIEQEPFDTAKVAVLYRLQYLRDSTKTDKYEEGETLLQISDNHLCFGDYHRILADSLNNRLAESKKRKKDKAMANEHTKEVMATAFYFKYATNLNNKRSRAQCWRINKYEYTDTVPQLNWKFVDGDTLIVGKPCKKALCSYGGRDYVAWYAESIALPYGPAMFGGLPGLIMKLADTKLNWIFTFSGMSTNAYPRTMYLNKPRKLRKVSKSEALTAYRNETENFTAIMVAAGDLEMYDANGNKVPFPVKKFPCNMLELTW